MKTYEEAKHEIHIFAKKYAYNVTEVRDLMFVAQRAIEMEPYIPLIERWGKRKPALKELYDILGFTEDEKRSLWQ